MFRHILIPTDGSAIASKAVRAGIRFARETGARVTGYYAFDTLRAHVNYGGYMASDKFVVQMDRRAEHVGRKYLDAMAKLARAARVRFDSVCAKVPDPAEGIVATARRKNCDVIFIASHGRSGLSKLIMGSVTQKVLAHSKIPVLIYR
jgi:nucleotide-binding universal stress UspA family protein